MVVVASVEVPVTTNSPVVVALTAVRLVVDAVPIDALVDARLVEVALVITALVMTALVVVEFPTTRSVIEASVATRDEMKELVPVLFT